jgi:hypothetical protein
MKTRKASKVSKASKKSKPVSLPELRAGLLYLHSYGESAVKKATTLREAAVQFANEWAAVFHKKISVKNAMDYLKHAITYNAHSATTKRKSHTKKKMRGGEAPIDYTMRSGAPVPYGVFPSYVSKGFFDPQPSSSTLCAAGGVLGSQAGGAGIIDGITQIFRHPPASNPTSVVTDIRTTLNGQPLGPGPDPTTHTYKMMTSPGMQNFSRLYESAQTSKI